MDDNKEAQKRLKVIIVGGSIAGLTLAHSLHHANIDFTVLESHDEIAPQVGASVGLTPYGCRLLDQLGIMDDIMKEIYPIQKSVFLRATGKTICENTVPGRMQERHGYPFAFLERQKLLELLYGHLPREAQDWVLMQKRVVRVESLDSGVVVHCADGSVFEGDLVVGADGVHSMVREQMWQHMLRHGMTDIVTRERAKMKTEFTCVFGISHPTPGLAIGDVYRRFDNGLSSLMVPAKNGLIYWFLFNKIDHTYIASSDPRARKRNMKDVLFDHMDKYVAKGVPFAAVWKNVITTTFVPTEEALYGHWTYDRFACIGDAAHKMTPQGGHGANSAIESAITLANHLNAFNQKSKTSSLDDLRDALSTWQSSRKPRAKRIYAIAASFGHLEALTTLKNRIIALYLLPYMNNSFIKRATKEQIGIESLDYLPPPKRDAECTIPYDRRYRFIHEEPFLRRLLFSLPLVICLLGACYTITMPILESRTWENSTGEFADLTQSNYGVDALDSFLAPIITCFLPSLSGSDSVSRLQMLITLTDFTPMYGVWLLEGHRKMSSWSNIFYTTIFGLSSQLLGIGNIAPIYFLFDYIQSPLSNLLIADSATISIPAVKSILPALLLGCYLPTWAGFIAPTLAAKQQINAIWRLFPLLVPLLQGVFIMGLKSVDTGAKAGGKRGDIAYIRVVSVLMMLISGTVFLYVRGAVPEGVFFLQVFFPRLDSLQSVLSFPKGTALLLQYNGIFALGSGLIWIVLSFRDLKLYGIDVSWAKILGVLTITTCTLGPGAAFILGWGWREHILASIRQ